MNGPDIFSERGITPEIAERRPYVRWTPEDCRPVHDEFKDLPGKARAFLSKVTGKKVGQPGFLIKRHPPPGLGLERVYAELRPDREVKTGKKIRHDHAKDFAGRPAWQLERHLKKHHGGCDVLGKHEHEKSAKYLFAPAPRIKKTWGHDHDDFYAGEAKRRVRHEAREHGDEVVAGWHSHVRSVKDRAVNYAKRLDMHPFAVPLFGQASRVFFVIEGCLKADSILSLGEAVFSVPSVGQWNAPELQAFALKYLVGKTVYIVPDADWSQNPAVVMQALLCRTFLRNLGIEAHVAAPPGTRTPTGELAHKGVDDFVGPRELGGGGGRLDDLVVIRRELPPAFDREVRELGRPRLRGRLPRITGLANEANALQNLILLAADGHGEYPKGTLDKNLSQLAKLMGHHHHKNAGRALEKLEEHGLIHIDGTSETQPGGWKGDYYDWELDWVNRPIITIAPELQAVELKPITVGELTREVEQFPTRDMEQIESLLHEGRELEAA